MRLPGAPVIPGIRRGPINNWTEAAGTGAVVAIDPATGDERWRFEMTDVTSSGILTTASDLLFTGNREGYFHALDARDGSLLWRVTLGGMIANGRGRQQPLRVRAPRLKTAAGKGTTMPIYEYECRGAGTSSNWSCCRTARPRRRAPNARAKRSNVSCRTSR